MKKLMSMILALMMALSLVACGDKGGSGGNGDNGDSASKPEHTDFFVNCKDCFDWWMCHFFIV